MADNAADARARIEDPHTWANHETIIALIERNPSLRGFVYGYLAEHMFEDRVLHGITGVTEISKDDDHTKSKADRSFRYRDRIYTVQNKSIQTNSLKDLDNGTIQAKIQNDASDSREVQLPTGRIIKTTCYVVGEYDILAVNLYPFTGSWDDWAYKRNDDLTRSRYHKYTDEEKQSLLATLETITWPLDETWATDIRDLLDGKIGRPHQEQTATVIEE